MVCQDTGVLRCLEMASVRTRRRADGSIINYSVLFTLDGKQTSVPWQTEFEANRFRDLVNQVGARHAMQIEGIQPAKTGGAKPTGPTVKEWLTRYVDNLTGVEQKSIDDYRRYIRRDIAPILGDIPLVALQEEDIARWVKHLETTNSARGRLRAPKTLKNVHGFLSGALSAAVPRHIAANPAAGRRLPKGGEDDETEVVDRLLSHDEFNRLLSATTDYWKPMVEFMVASGARWGEVSALKPGDVNREAGTVHIRRAWKYSSAGYKTGRTKTKRSNRIINVPRSVLDQLDYSHEWLFVNRAGGPVRYQGFRRRVWDKAVARAKLDPPPTPHALRHTCGSWMLNQGLPVILVSRHLGHESIDVTVNIYGHLDRTVAARAAEVMGELLARPERKAIES